MYHTRMCVLNFIGNYFKTLMVGDIMAGLVCGPIFYLH